MRLHFSLFVICVTSVFGDDSLRLMLVGLDRLDKPITIQITRLAPNAIRLGQAFDALGGVFLNEVCAEGTPKEEDYLTDDIPQYGYAESFYELWRRQVVSASAQLAYGPINASGSYSKSSEALNSRFTHHLGATRSITLKKKYLDSIKPPASLIERAATGIERTFPETFGFSKRCGTHYVGSIVTGVSATVVYTSESDSERESGAIKSMMGVAVKFLNESAGAFESEEQWNRLASGNRIVLSTSATGVAELKELNLKGLKAFMSGLSELAKKDGRGVPMLAELYPYQRGGSEKDFAGETTISSTSKVTVKEVLERAESTIINLQKVRDGYRYATKYPKQFWRVNTDKSEKYSADLAERIRRLQSMALGCLDVDRRSSSCSALEKTLSHYRATSIIGPKRMEQHLLPVNDASYCKDSGSPVPSAVAATTSASGRPFLVRLGGRVRLDPNRSGAGVTLFHIKMATTETDMPPETPWGDNEKRDGREFSGERDVRVFYYIWDAEQCSNNIPEPGDELRVETLHTLPYSPLPPLQ